MTRSRRAIVSVLSGAAALLLVLGRTVPALQHVQALVWLGALALLVAAVACAVTTVGRGRGSTDR